MPLDRGSVDSKVELRPGLDVREFAVKALARGEKVRLFPVAEQVELGVQARGNDPVELPTQTWGMPQGEYLKLWELPVDEGPAASERWWFLGQTQDGTWQIAVSLTEVEAADLARKYPELQFALVTTIGAWLPDDDALVATQAAALARWHTIEKFCTRCGNPVAVTEAGWSVTCQNCGAVEYPRSDPAVIVAVTDSADRLLLLHNKAWGPKRASVLAGFVEAGECPERTVVREAKEEAALEVTDVEYVGSQPWPKPRSLMLCYTAKVAANRESKPHPDGNEIDKARFYSRTELEEAVLSGELLLPGATAVARGLIENWYGKPLPQKS